MKSRRNTNQSGALRASGIALLAILLLACGSDADPSSGPPVGGLDAVVGTSDAILSCLDPAASPCQAPTPFCAARGECVTCIDTTHCAPGLSCVDGACTSGLCTPADTRCAGEALETCNSDGSAWVSTDCPAGTCQGGVCVGCDPGARHCEGQDVHQCQPDGSGSQVVTTCAGERVCRDGACLACLPDTRRCTAAGTVETCDAAGAYNVSADCGGQGLVCQAGSCVSACSRDPKSKSNAGCDYWAVDLDNHWGARDGPFALIVSNLGEITARVSVTKRDGSAATPLAVMHKDVAPGALATFELPNRNMNGAGIFWAGYKVDSTAPIVAYQFNPLDNVAVFSNDATLLLPSNTFGTEYIVMSRFELLGGGPIQGQPVPYRGSISVVASSPGTVVTVTPTARTQAGTNMPVMLPGQSYTFTIDPFQVLNIKSDQDKGDLTGTIISATKPVGVFGGHEAAVSGSACCADHLEHQMFPVSTWGHVYIASRSQPRSAESDYWRIVASEDDTSIAFNPPSVQTTRNLNRGESFEFPSKMDFVITATKPVMVGQLLASSAEIVNPPAYSDCTSTRLCAPNYSCELDSNFVTRSCYPPRCAVAGTEAGCPAGHVCHCYQSGNCGCAPIGDPSLILVPPVEQFRNEYVFLAPNKYAKDYINIVAPTAAAATLDGNAVPAAAWVAINADWKVARLEVADGVHRVVANQNVGVIAYGYDKDVSYGYAAGLNLVDR